MACYRLLRAAENDPDEIAAYTIAKHGVQQAKVYRDRLLKAFEAIAEHPEIGTNQSHVFPELRRFVHESHAIYYRVAEKEIAMMRLLGPGQDPLSQQQGAGDR